MRATLRQTRPIVSVRGSETRTAAPTTMAFARLTSTPRMTPTPMTPGKRAPTRTRSGNHMGMVEQTPMACLVQLKKVSPMVLQSERR